MSLWTACLDFDSDNHNSQVFHRAFLCSNLPSYKDLKRSVVAALHYLSFVKSRLQLEFTHPFISIMLNAFAASIYNSFDVSTPLGSFSVSTPSYTPSHNVEPSMVSRRDPGRHLPQIYSSSGSTQVIRSAHFVQLYGDGLLNGTIVRNFHAYVAIAHLR